MFGRRNFRIYSDILGIVYELFLLHSVHTKYALCYCISSSGVFSHINYWVKVTDRRLQSSVETLVMTVSYWTSVDGIKIKSILEEGSYLFVDMETGIIRYSCKYREYKFCKIQNRIISCNPFWLLQTNFSSIWTSVSFTVAYWFVTHV
jgi:hypothetical protein